MKSVYILFIALGLIVQFDGSDMRCGDISPEPHCTALYNNMYKIVQERMVDNKSEFQQFDHHLRQCENMTQVLLGPPPEFDSEEGKVQRLLNIILVSNNSQIVQLTKNVCRMFVSIVDTLEPLKMYNSTNCTIPTIFSWLFSDKANAAIIDSGVVECIEFSNMLQDVKVHNALHCDAWKSEEKIENGDVYGSID